MEPPLSHVRDASAVFLKGNYKKVLDITTDGLAKFPRSISLLEYRFLAAEQLQQYSVARETLQTILEIDPNSPMAHRSLGRMLACCPDAAFRDPKLALTHALKAKELRVFPDGETEDTLAAVLAANGQFEKAVATQENAVKIWLVSDKEGAATRLELYKNKQQYFQKPKVPTTIVPRL